MKIEIFNFNKFSTDYNCLIKGNKLVGLTKVIKNRDKTYLTILYGRNFFLMANVHWNLNSYRIQLFQLYSKNIEVYLQSKYLVQG
jgi:hypothetical protein